MKILGLIIIVLFCSCCSTNINIVGKYASKTNPNCFQFNDDSSFIYEFRLYHMYEYSTGTWIKNKKNAIEINSLIKNTIIPLKINEEENTDQDKSNISVFLKVAHGLQLSDYRCEIYLNGSYYNVKRCDSLSSIQISMPVNNIYFEFIKAPLVFNSTLMSLPLTTEKYETIRNNSVNLKIEASFNDSLFSYRTFNREIVKVKNNYIKYFFNKKWQKIPKVPNESNIFIH